MPRWASEESKTDRNRKKNISMGFETWERLKTFGKFGDSFDDILNRLMDYKDQQPQKGVAQIVFDESSFTNEKDRIKAREVFEKTKQYFNSHNIEVQQKGKTTITLAQAEDKILRDKFESQIQEDKPKKLAKQQ